MAVPKVMGIENEYGFAGFDVVDGHRKSHNHDLDRIVTMLLHQVAKDAGGWHKDATPSRHFLPNGGFIYKDLSHPEYATPECADAEQLVIHDRAGDRAFAAATRTLRERPDLRSLSPGLTDLAIFKHNADMRGNAFGTHENYSADSRVPQAAYEALLMPFLASRPLIAGAGGFESSSEEAHGLRFVLSPRAQYIEHTFSTKSTMERPMFCVRGESLADNDRYQRVHLLCGDANRCDVSTFLKVGTTAIVLAMIEDGFVPPDVALEDPVEALHQASRAVDGSALLLRPDGTHIRALDHQYRYLEAAHEYAATVGLDACGGAVGKDVLTRWEAALDAISTGNIDTLFGVLDWATKLRIVERRADQLEATGADPMSLRQALLGADLAYAHLDPERSTYEQLRARGGITTLSSVEPSVGDPGPPETRARLRSVVVQRWCKDIVAMSWDELVIEHDRIPVEIPLPEPLLAPELRGVGLNDWADAPDFLSALGKASPTSMIAVARATVDPFPLRAIARRLEDLVNANGEDPRYREAMYEIGRSAVRGLRKSNLTAREPRFATYCSLAEHAFLHAGDPGALQRELFAAQRTVLDAIAEIERGGPAPQAPALRVPVHTERGDGTQTHMRRKLRTMEVLRAAVAWADARAAQGRDASPGPGIEPLGR